MNMIPQVIKLVKTYVDSVGGTPPLSTQASAQIAAALNQQNIPNPVTQAPQVPKPWDFPTLMSLVSPASQAKLGTYQYLIELVSDLRNRDTVAALTWSSLLGSMGLLQVSEAQAIQALLTSTISDPAWTAQISWAQANLGGPVSVNDISQCYPNNG